jgi:sec-independent protein translocase protein TatC
VKEGFSMSRTKQMSMWGHIGELRKRLFVVFFVFVLCLVVGFYFAQDVITYLKEQPLAEELELIFISPTDAFKVYFQFSLFVALSLTFPFLLFQIWAFISPGLTKREKRLTLSFIPGVILLFIGGIAFGYFWLFPFVFNFLTNIAEQLGATQLYGMLQYFSFMFALVLPFGFLFQLPLVILFLTRLEVITPHFLRKIRKYAYFALFVIAAIITPPELLSHLLVTVPLIILYEVSVWLSAVSHRRLIAERLKREKEEQKSAQQIDNGT